MSRLLITTAIVSAISLTTDAHAADFTGNIKRIRVKKRKISSNQYRAVVNTSTEGAVPAGVQVSLEGLDEGMSDVSGSASVPSDATIILAGALELDTAPGEEPSAEAVFQITPFGTSGVPILDSFEVSVPLTDAAAEYTAFEWSLGAGEVLWAVDDPDGETADLWLELGSSEWGDDPLEYVQIEVIEASGDVSPLGATVDLEIAVAEAKWAVDLEGEVGVGRYQATAQALDRAGEVGAEAQVLRTEPGEAQAGPLVFTKLVEKDEGEFRLTAWAAFLDGSSDGALSVVVQDGRGETVATEDLRERSRALAFEQPGVTFQDDPGGFTYYCTLSTLDAEGRTIEQSEEIEFTVSDEPAVFELASGHKVLIEKDLEEQRQEILRVVVLVDDEDAEVAGAELSFEEPFEGPEPDEVQLTLQPAGTFIKARTSFSATGDTFSLSMTATSSETEERLSFTQSADIGGATSAPALSAGSEKYGDIMIDGVELEWK